MLASTHVPEPAPRAARAARILTLLAGPALFLGCATGRANAPAANVRPQVLTVPQILEMQSQSTSPGIMYGKVQGSGTVYRLTPAQRDMLQANRVPNSLMSYMLLTYEHAIQQNPDLAKGDAHWTKIGDYWYGGLPFGWPSAWVVGAPALGERLR